MMAALRGAGMSDQASDNPLCTDGFEFVEFTGPAPEKLARVFLDLGFVEAARHRHKNVSLYRQGDINFILNREPRGQANRFARRHGPSANAMAFRVKDAALAFSAALRRGAAAIEQPVGPMELKIPAIAGIGGMVIYLVDRYGARTIYDVDFDPVTPAPDTTGVGLTVIDHLTHNLQRGHMERWSEFYERVFAFREIRYFDIEGKLTGLVSRALASPCGKIRIPLNESRDDQSQIEEFLQRYHGEGIQHIALACDDICAVVERLRSRGIPFQETPATYYEAVDARLPGHGVDLERLRRNGILIDGAPAQGQGVLLQIFTRDAIGPIFFEIIERRGNEGFGEGNFRALFESIELDQIRRGVLRERA
jgi:4-hydroxyphenylpyruvate dioxygenase